MSNKLTSASLRNIQCLLWNAFSVVTANDKYHLIAAPSFTVDKITTVLGASSFGCTKIILTVAGGAIAPAWVKIGVNCSVNVTKGGVPITITTVVSDVSSDTKTITLIPTNQQSEGITTAWSGSALDAIAGSVVNTVTLVVQYQKAMLTVAATEVGNVLIAPSADVNGSNPPWFQTLTPGGPEYELSAPTGAKFDLSDWWLKASSGTPALSIRFA